MTVFWFENHVGIVGCRSVTVCWYTHTCQVLRFGRNHYVFFTKNPQLLPGIINYGFIATCCDSRDTGEECETSFYKLMLFVLQKSDFKQRLLLLLLLLLLQGSR